DDGVRRALAEGRADRNVIGRDAADDDAPAFESGLSDEAVAEAPDVRDALALLERVAREQAKDLTLVVALRHVERTVVRVHERSELVEDLARHRQEVALTLQHTGDPREVRLQPVLLLVDLRGLRERANHLVDGVFE